MTTAPESGLESELDGDALADLILRLLCDQRLRDRLAADGAAAVAANAGELACLRTVDHGELDTAARRFRSHLWRLGRGGGLATAFQRSLRCAPVAGLSETDLIAGFLDSVHFGRFRLVPHAGMGVCVEEAFASYLLDLADQPPDGTGRLPDTVRHELMIALFTALATEQPLSFTIGVPDVLTTTRGHAALHRYATASIASWSDSEATSACPDAVPYAYFATAAGFAHGVVSERVAAAFQADPTPAAAQARRALARRGLW